MCGTFSQIHIQLVFAVQGRNSLILPCWEERLYRYITGIVETKKQKMLAINGMPDHIHMLLGVRPTCRLSDMVREIKKSSHQFIGKQGFAQHRFRWQEGYGAFSYSYSSLPRVISYIHNQKEHHRKRTFKEEYLNLLTRFNVEFKPEHLFEWIA